MDSFSDSLLAKRNAILKSLKKPAKEGSPESRSKTSVKAQGTALEYDSLKSGVYNSIHTLLCRGYDFNKILVESGVNRAFLEQAFYELGIRAIKEEGQQLTSVSRNRDVDVEKYRSQPDEFSVGRDSDVSFDNSKTTGGGHRDSIRGINQLDRTLQRTVNKSVDFDIQHENTVVKSKNIEVEMRLFMLRVQLEINKFSTLIRSKEFAKQLEHQMVQKNILSKKNLIVSYLNQVFDKICEKGRVIELELTDNTNNKNDAINLKRERREIHEDDNAGSPSPQMMKRKKESNERSENRKTSRSIREETNVEDKDSTETRFHEISKVCIYTLQFLSPNFLLTSMFACLHDFHVYYSSHGKYANHQDSPIYNILVRIDQYCRTINLIKTN